MIVKFTGLIKKRFSDQEIQDLIQDFIVLKTPGSENSALLLGKDSEYLFPKSKIAKLWHAHVMPNEKKSKIRWIELYKNKETKVSDGALIYVDANNGTFLLIFFLQEGAHELAEMKTIEDEKLMKYFMKIAEEFVLHSKIIA